MDIPRVLEIVDLGETDESKREAIKKREGRLVYVCSEDFMKGFYNRGFPVTDFPEEEFFYFMKDNNLFLRKKEIQTPEEKRIFTLDLMKKGQIIWYHDLSGLLDVFRLHSP